MEVILSMKHLNKMEDGDYLIYTDCGDMFHEDLISLLKNS